MLNLLIVSEETGPIRTLRSELGKRGLACAVSPSFAPEALKLTVPAPEVVFVHINGAEPGTGPWLVGPRIKDAAGLPVLALVSKDALNYIDERFGADDFVVEPWDPREVAARARRLVLKSKPGSGAEQIRSDDLIIDLARCEVFVGGRRVELTFREYELLKFLASNRGRAFTREALLDKVWGFDYFGGDRTVDVHVRRLRSKIGDTDGTFIETVRNIGYRFRGDKSP
ncbi:MAG: response regulator transcription factor [Chloroflexi bacterium]|nr:response regulator transcription factor [Chloroflexota bacterium]